MPWDECRLQCACPLRCVGKVQRILTYVIRHAVKTLLGYLPCDGIGGLASIRLCTTGIEKEGSVSIASVADAG